METFITILSIIAFAIVVLVLYNVLKTFVLFKIKINKWIVFGVAMVLFIVPLIVWPNMPTYIKNYIIPGSTVILFLWFMDLSGYMKKRNSFKSNGSKTNYTTTKTKNDKKKDVVIRPKAKPNRVKNFKK